MRNFWGSFSILVLSSINIGCTNEGFKAFDVKSFSIPLASEEPDDQSLSAPQISISSHINDQIISSSSILLSGACENSLNVDFSGDAVASPYFIVGWVCATS
ncbi:MAG: hypothetical protein KDD34_01405 [Bdellovibrionales bacterium]|nr:hypothetical protein [Bdellovibrionales bacterium]